MLNSCKHALLTLGIALGNYVALQTVHADPGRVDPMKGPAQIHVDTVEVPLSIQAYARGVRTDEESGDAIALPPLKKAPALHAPAQSVDTLPFYYAVSDLTRRIALPTYGDDNDWQPLGRHWNATVDSERVVMLECGRESDFVARPGYRNMESLFGLTGYEIRHHPCAIAQRLEYQWFRGTILGQDFWHALDEHGNVLCYSLDGMRCLAESEMNAQWAMDTVFGHQILSNPDMISDTPAPGDLPYLHGYNLNDDVILRALAQPVACTAEQQNSPAHWCAQLARPDASNRYFTNSDIIDGNTQGLYRTLQNYRDAEFARIDDELAYAVTRNSLQHQKRHYRNLADHWLCYSGWIPLSVCRHYKDVAEDFAEALKDLERLRKDRRAVVEAEVAEMMAVRAHELHKQMSVNSDDPALKQLLYLESLEIAELKALQVYYDKTSKELAKAYADSLKAAVAEQGESLAVAVYDDAEMLPLVGPFLQTLADFVSHPSARNFLKVMMQANGVEATMEEVVGGIQSQVETEVRLVENAEDIVHDLKKFYGYFEDHTVLQMLADLVNETVTRYSLDAIDTARELGLLRRDPSDDKGTLVEHIDFAALKSHINLAPGPADWDMDGYDVWLDQSEPAQRFREKLYLGTQLSATLPMHGSGDSPLEYRFHHPEAFYTEESPSAEADAVNTALARRVRRRVDAIFTHAMGMDYPKAVQNHAVADAPTRDDVLLELYRMLTEPIYSELRRPRWADSRLLDARPGAFIYDQNHAVIVLNRDLMAGSTPEDFARVYFEELGHLMNWWRCRGFGINPYLCEVHGDVGARFRDAMLLEAGWSDDDHFATLLHGLPAHTKVDSSLLRFEDGSYARLEGWPNVLTWNDNLEGGGKANLMLRTGVDVSGLAGGWLGSELTFDFVFNWPQSERENDLFAKPVGERCPKDDISYEKACDLPTIWLNVALRDMLKFSVMSVFKVGEQWWTNQRESIALIGEGGKSVADLNLIDFSPRVARKHGLKIPFQYDQGTGLFQPKPEFVMYYRDFEVELESKIDLRTVLKLLKFDYRDYMSGKIGQGPTQVAWGIEPLIKSNLFTAKYLTEVPAYTRNEDGELDRDLAVMLGVAATDIVTAAVGCAVGAALDVYLTDGEALRDVGTACQVSSVATEAVLDLGLDLLAWGGEADAIGVKAAVGSTISVASMELTAKNVKPVLRSLAAAKGYNFKGLFMVRNGFGWTHAEHTFMAPHGEHLPGEYFFD